MVSFERPSASPEAEAAPWDRVADPVPGGRSWYPRIGKSLADAVLALLLLIVLLPALLGIALLVLVTMGRPVLFRQQRVGKGGRQFTVYKFRTMNGSGPSPESLRPGPDGRIVHKVADDPRITPVGGWLRRLSLDELPQLWNVLQGDMSLVGPRPELVEIVEQYAPWQHRRHDVKPGITGLWQISERGTTLMHEATQLDLEYVYSVSLRTDVRILRATIPSLLGKHRGI